MNNLVYILLFIVYLWLIGLTYYFYSIYSHFQKLISGTKNSNLKEILDKILSNLDLGQKNINSLTQKINKISHEVIYHIQKVGIIRFNPFSDTGGDQSFVLAILDGESNGIVLTSLHNRGITRWYAKNVNKGKGVDHELSNEEIQAIKKAENINPIKK